MSKKPKLLLDKDPWMLGENIPDSDIFFFQIPFSAFTSDTSYPFVRNYRRVLAIFKKFHMDFYFGEKDSYLVAESILQGLVDRPKFGPSMNKDIVKWSYKMIGFAKKVNKIDLSKMSNKQLWQLYKNHDEIHTKLYTYGWLPVALDMFHNNFTNKLKQYLYSVCDSKEEAEKAFLLFTTPSKKTILAQEQEQFLKIYKKHKVFLTKYTKGSLPKDLTKALVGHVKSWGHLGYIYAGNAPAFDSKYYLNELVYFARSKGNAENVLKKESRQLQEAKAKQQRLYKKFKINQVYRRLFEVAKDFALTKLVRRHAQLFTLFTMHKTLLTEIAKRLKVTRTQVQFMLMNEVKNALVHNTLDKQVLFQRVNSSVLYTERNFEKVYIDKQAEKFKKQVVVKIDKNQKELIGQTAQPGKATGKVKIIIRAKDMKKMNKGDILVSIATDPDIVPAMKKAAAIITEQGGITSHAAIVSREMGTPCIIGTKIATKIFKDGDLVEVDANKGIVRKI
jgi:phosphohistidine swiveling domain-containing protein